MNLRDCEILIMLYEYGNLTEVAKEMFVTQPALTYRIKQIEQYFGVSIIKKNKKNHFTEEGLLILEYAKQIVRSTNKLMDTLTDMKNGLTGTIKIGASRAFALYELPMFLRKFQRKFPNLNFKVVSGLNHEIDQLVSEGKVHLGIWRGNINRENDYNLLLSTEVIYIINKSPIILKDLNELHRIDYSTDPQLKLEIDKWWSSNYATPPKEIMKIDTLESAKRLVEHSLGYAIVPGIVVKNNKQLYKTPLLDAKNTPIEWKTWLIYNEDIVHLKFIKEFSKYIINYYDK